MTFFIYRTTTAAKQTFLYDMLVENDRYDHENWHKMTLFTNIR